MVINTAKMNARQFLQLGQHPPGVKLKRSKYVPIGRGQGSAVVRLAPFADLKILLKELWRK